MSLNNNISLINLDSQFNPFYSSITIDSSGNVGVGKTNPSTNLDVSGNINLSGIISGSGANLISLNATNITSGVLTVNRGGTGGTTLTAGSLLVGNGTSTILQPTNLVWDNTNNRLGIGAANPASKLHITHNSTSTTAFEGVGILLQNTSNTANNNSWILNQIAGSTANKVIYSMDVSGSYGWSMYLQGNDTTNKTLRFNSAYNATTGNDRMVINGANGNVGIGVDNPSQKLEVNGVLKLGGTPTPTNDNLGVYIWNQANVGPTIAGASFEIRTGGDNVRLRINSAGNVGIGTTNPVYKCHIKTTYDQIATGLHLEASDSTTDPNQYALTLYAYVVGGGQVGWRFRTQSVTGGARTALGFRHDGTVDITGTLNSGATNINGDLFITSSRLVLRGTQPTLYLRDTDHRSGMIHMNSNVMYFLNGNGVDSETWAVQNSQNWCLQLNMTNNDATFGGAVTAISFSGSGTGLTALNATNISSGTLIVGRGGTGATTLTSGRLLIGNGTGALLQSANLVWDNTNNRIGIGTTVPLASLDIVKEILSGTTTDLLNMRFDANWGLKLQEHYAGAYNIQYNFIHRYNSVDYNSLTFKGANVGIGTTNPQRPLHVQSAIRIGGTGAALDFGDDLTTQIYRSGTLQEMRFSTNTADRLRISSNGVVSIQHPESSFALPYMAAGSLIIGNNTQNYGGDSGWTTNTAGLIMECLNNTEIIIHDSGTAIHSFMYYTTSGNFQIGRNAGNGVANVSFGGNVSIGKTSASTALDVNGTVTATGLLCSGGAIIIDTSNNVNIDSGLLYIDGSNNNVGIGTTQPTKKLHVTGDTRIEGNLTVNGTLTQINTNVGTTEQLNITNDGTGPALIVNQTGAQPIIEIQDDGYACFKIFDGGNLGIGTATKVVSVDISGNLKVSSTITGTSFAGSGATLTTLNASNISSGTLSVAQGGTSSTTLAAGQLLVGNGTNSLIQSSNLVWDNSNNRLGIGIANPLYRFFMQTSYDNIETGFHLDASDMGVLNKYALTIYAYALGAGQVGWKFRTQSPTGGINTPLTFTNNGSVLLPGSISSGAITSTGVVSATSFTGSGANITTINANSISSGTLIVDRGGTGSTSLTSGQLLIGNGTGALIQSANLVWDNTENRLTISGSTRQKLMLTNTQTSSASFMGFSNSANDSLAYIGVDGSGLTNFVYGALTLGTWKDKPILFTTGATNTEKMRIESNGNIGINTTTNISSKLTINNININGFDHSESPLTITHPTPTSTSALNDPKTLLHLCRQGTNAQAYGAKASFKLCRWQNNGVNSRTRLDINLSHNQYDDVNIMSLRSDGFVGIGITNPTTTLDVNGQITCTGTLNINTGSINASGTTGPFIIDPNYTTNSYVKIWDGLDIVGWANISGNVGIGKTIPTTILDVNGTITATLFAGSGASITTLNANSISSGILAVDRGGIGIGTLTSGQLLIGNGTNALLQSANLVWDNTNNRLGIGKANPSTTLDINGTITSTGLLCSGGAIIIDTSNNVNIDSGLLYIDGSNNNVGIGTTQPTKKLHVTGDTRIEGNLTVNGTLTQINTTVGTTEQLNITNDGTGPALIVNQTGAQPIIEIQDDGVTCFKIFDGGDLGIGTATKVVNVDISGNIILSGTITGTSFVGSGASLTTLNASNISSGTLSVERGGTGSTTLAAGQLLVGNTTGALIQSANLSWDNSNSRLGIGITNPTQILQVGGAGRLRIANSNSDYSIIGSTDTDGASNTRIVISGINRTSYNGNINYLAPSTGQHIFHTTTAETERMRIWSNGAVTIQNNGGALPVNVNYMRAGSLTIGNIDQNYGGGTSSWSSATEGTAGLLLECLNNTEIMVHDVSNSLHSFMRYTSNGNFQIGRNAGHGVANISFAGNVGIGKTPGTPLDINGTVTATLFSGSGASLTTLNASNISSGTLSVERGGTGVTTLAATQLLIGNGTGSLLQSANLVWDNVNNRVGIGKANPGTTLDVNGTITTSGLLCSGGAIIIDTSNNVNIDSGVLYIDGSNNNVGIGTTQPTKKLHVTGDTRIEGNLTVNGTLTQINTNANTTEQLLITNDGTGPALIVNQTGAQSIIEIQDDGTACFKIFDGGNLGIGTATKVVSVDISGNLKVSGTVTGTSFAGSGAGLTALNASNISSGTLVVAQGGTGSTTLAAGQLLVGNGTNALIQSSNLVWNNANNRLDIQGTNPTIKLFDINGDGNSILAFREFSDNYGYDIAYIGNTDNKFYIRGYNNSATPRIDMTFNRSDGYVGIGKTNPVTTLDVNGTITATLFSGSGASLTALNASNISSGTLSVSQGGTGSTTLAAGQLLIGNTTGALIQSANLVWDNVNNRLGIAKTNPAYPLDVVGNINFTGDLYKSGQLYISSQWTTSSTNIYYNTGNVIIGATTNSSDDGSVSIVLPDAKLYVRGTASTGATTDIVFRGGLEGGNNGKVKIWLSNDAAHCSYIQSEHVSSGNTQLTFGTAAGNVLPVERMRIDNTGNVGIAKTNPGTALDVNGTITGTLFSGSGASLTLLNATNISSGTLAVARGGTGAVTLTVNQLLVGNGTNALIQSANLSWNNTSNILTATNFAGSGTALTALNASNVSSGTLIAANGGTGCTSLNTNFFDTSGGILSLKSGSSQWTTLNNNIYFNTANVGIGITNPSYKLHVDDGIAFIGDSLYLNNLSSNIANNYYLLFDNTYNGTIGSGIPANKIRLMNDTSNNILAGFGMENNCVTYHSGSLGSHTFYSGTSSTNYGTGRFQIDQLGNITCTGDIAAFTSISDQRLKTNIIKLDSSIDIIKKLNPVKFNWKHNDFIIENKQGSEDVGFIAQEIEKVIPLAAGEYKVINSEETYKNIKYERIIPYLVKSMQELLEKVEKLEEEIVHLKSLS